jgi:hypothetical protein
MLYIRHIITPPDATTYDIPLDAPLNLLDSTGSATPIGAVVVVSKADVVVDRTVQVVAPVLAPVIEPEGHVWQSLCCVRLVWLWYVPVEQCVQDTTFEAEEYLPAGQTVHVVAPALAPVFVMDPAAQLVQAATFEAVEYFPAVHAVHVVAPVFTPVSVMDPAIQSVQAATFEAVEYFPAVHAVHVVAPVFTPVSVMDPAIQSVQAATPEAVEYFPAVHAVQVVAPVFTPVFVIDPAAQPVQLPPVKLLALWYWPVGQASHVSAVAEPEPLKNPALQDVECAVQVATGGKEDWLTVTLVP